MISKGNTHADGTKLAAYLTTGKASERAELWELRGFGMGTIADAFRTVHVMAEATNCEQPFFHVQVRNRDGELLTRRQWEHTADRIDGMLGLKDQPRAVAFHIDEKTGHEHMHVAWSRIDENTMTARALPFFKDRLRKISRELEREFALSPVTNQREGEIKFAPTRIEHEQARRLGQNVHELRNTIRECWDRSDCGRSFQSALEHEGFTLAQGDRRGYVVIDRAGGLHPLGKRILDMTAAKIRDRLSDFSADDLPTVETARAFVEEARQEMQPQEQSKPEPCWDRDEYDRTWQDAVINAAIAKETASDEPIEKAAGSRKKEWPIHLPVPEPSEDSPEYCFRDSAKATAHRTAEPNAVPIKPDAEATTTSIPAAKAPEFALRRTTGTVTPTAKSEVSASMQRPWN
jgi:hypothetical protein